MTNQEVYDYIKNNIKSDANYISDEYVKAGYGQIKGGYFDVAYRNNEKRCKKDAKPSQKWHLIVSYYDSKKANNNFDMQKKASLSRIMCPQLMMWIAEIAGLNEKILRKAIEEAINYEKNNKTKDSRKIKKDVLINALHWNEINRVIQTANTWDEVINQVSKIV